MIIFSSYNFRQTNIQFLLAFATWQFVQGRMSENEISPKGQLNSEWIYEDIDFPKFHIARISALKFFVASLGLPGDLVSNIINKETNRKPPGSYTKFQGRNPYNILVAILEKSMFS